MLKSVIRKARQVNLGDKVSIDTEVEGRLVFSNEPNVPAIVPLGQAVQFSAHIVRNGGSALDPSRSVARYEGEYFVFADGFQLGLAEIRGGNWFEVL